MSHPRLLGIVLAIATISSSAPAQTAPPTENLQPLYSAMLADLQPLLATYKKDRGWADREALGVGELFALNWYLPNLQDLCDPILAEKSTDQKKCLAKELDRAERMINPFKTLLVKYAQLVRKGRDLPEALNIQPEATSGVFEAWASLAEAYRTLGQGARAKAEFDLALLLDVNLADAYEEHYARALSVKQKTDADVRRIKGDIEASRTSRRTSWMEVLGTAVDAYAASKRSETVRGGANRSSNDALVLNDPRTPTGSSSTSGGACSGSLRSFGLSCPSLEEGSLTALCQEALRERVDLAIAKAKTSGLSKLAAIAQMQEQAGASEAAMRQAGSCISQSSQQGPNQLERVRNWRAGGSIPTAPNMNTSCVQSYIQNDIQASLNRAMIQAFQQCW